MGGERAENIETLIAIIRERFGPCKIILFGSRARGDFLKESDYDIIVVSEKFRGIPFLRRMEDVYELWDGDESIDIICYTPEEFDKKRKQIGIVSKAIEEGVVLV